ncbi:Chalcone synthase 1 [Dichanthelium oligosanthes]|uniref:Chalcone synthase 1 n=1 Tax=Dichanthelium oligosanthes TaxID=888268 RepID=A0A1E5VD29_9POAL|nr:Chalcone synthase 1 [Dichanthelium oligosanthes]
MGIGKAVPSHEFQQKSFSDYYFEITSSNHMVDLKAKFANICEKTMIEKRHFYMSNEMLRDSPSITAYSSTSLTRRQELADVGVPELGAKAARKAICDWGKQASDITHLVASTSSSGCMPGADCELARLLGLKPSTKRFMLYQTGCHGGCMALSLSKDLAENNPGARVLVVCSEVCTLSLRGPSESHIGDLVGQAILGDAAGAVVVGSSPAADEHTIFELVLTCQETIPGTEEALVSKLREEGILYSLHRDIPLHVSSSIERLVELMLKETMAPVPDLNEEVFWVVHPGGRGILDWIEGKLGLREEKLAASRSVMRQYGNTRCSSVILVMEEMRRRSEQHGLRTAGEGLDWGLLVGYGPGITVEAILLTALPDKAII